LRSRLECIQDVDWKKKAAMSHRVGFVVALVLTVGVVPRLLAPRFPNRHQPAPWTSAQEKNDPLTEDEVQQIRDNAIHPDERIRLYIKFIGERLDAIRQLAADRDAPNRAAQIRAKLEEFTNLCDEIQDNIDTYDSNHADIRKSLKDLVAVSSRWPEALNALPPDQNYDFSQKTALEAAQSANDEAKHISTTQDVFFDVHKKMRHGNGSAPD
jgi:hypothetical protein